MAVSGRAAFSGTSVAEATDPPDDGTGPAAVAALGAELTGAALVYRPEQEDLLLRLDLASLPPGAGGLPGILYGADLLVSDTRYEVRAVRAAATANPPRSLYAALYRCDPDCAEQAILTGSFGTTGLRVLVALPLEAIGAAEGTALTGLRAFTALGEASPGALHQLDEAVLESSTVPTSRVELGVAATSTPASAVAFSRNASLDAGRFSGTIPTAGLSPGSYRAWARACLGDTCGPAAPAGTDHPGG